jgi:uncharacterized protein (DUF1778 family)
MLVGLRPIFFVATVEVMAGKPKDPAKVKKYMLRVRMTEDERRLVDEAARLKSLETSTWVRVEIVAVARKVLARQSR